MSTALRVPGLVRQPVLVVRRRALARGRPLRLMPGPDSWPGRQTALLERPAVVPGSLREPAVRREESVVALARSRQPLAWLLALPAHPLMQAAWHCPPLQERSVAVLPSRSQALRGLRSQPESAWEHLAAPVYCCRGRE
jgi:hypothetical protein